MITINNVSMGFSGGRTLFKDVNLSIFANERIGLTGPNGSGKSTLFSIIRKEREPITGEVIVQKNINLGYLAQEAKFTSDRTVMEEITTGDARIQKLVDEKRRLEDTDKAGTDRYGDVLAELEQLGIYELEHKAEKILTGLGFKETEFHKPILQLSGGWQMRALLAKLLTYQYDLLLLDEPTNYLDLEATIWLKGFLKTYNGAFILISHDRVFLNDVTNYTILLDGGTMTKVKGNYEEYEKQRDISNLSLERRKKEIDKKREQLERFTERFHAQPNKASAVRNKKKMLERLDEIDIPQEQLSIKEFQFNNVQDSGYSIAYLSNIAKAYGEKKVYEKLDMEILKGQKLCLVGPNGAGKSTLLKMLAGVIDPDAGSIRYGHQVEKGYFSQTRTDVLSMERTAFEEVQLSAPPGTQNVQIRTLLALFNFYGDDVFKQVKVLSGGEKSRLILAKLLINPPNFMLLDEPTTHLDLDGVKALTNAFKSFPGTVCFISHDLFFIQELADHIAEVKGGSVRIYPGGLEYYLRKKSMNEAEARELSKKETQKKPDANKNKGQEEYELLKDARRQHEQAKKRLNDIRELLKKLEQENKDLETESYVKARMLNKFYETRDQEKSKEFSQRLKDIQSRQREIEAEIKQLVVERDQINK